ncbi:recombination mediator RecR [Ferrovibrio sp.]|uniref:recombination mediator RecR n=1 Tax=Ferrovibrio sp. TaxID=1917215 RepID=UPI0035AE4933
MAGSEIERVIQLLARLPGLGPRSARRAALHLLKKREALLLPLADALATMGRDVKACSVCGNLDSQSPCAICADPKRDAGQICVVETVADLWALERSGVFKGRYHVLGGSLSALDGRGPADLNLDGLLARASDAREIILATNATVEGQTTAHYITDRLRAAAPAGLTVSRLAHGVPVGGELDYLDDGTLGAALKARRLL